MASAARATAAGGFGMTIFTKVWSGVRHLARPARAAAVAASLAAAACATIVPTANNYRLYIATGATLATIWNEQAIDDVVDEALTADEIMRTVDASNALRLSLESCYRTAISVERDLDAVSLLCLIGLANGAIALENAVDGNDGASDLDYLSALAFLDAALLAPHPLMTDLVLAYAALDEGERLDIELVNRAMHQMRETNQTLRAVAEIALE